MDRDVEALFKPVSALSEAELAELKAQIAEYKRTGAIIEQGPYETRTFTVVNDDTVQMCRNLVVSSDSSAKTSAR